MRRMCAPMLFSLSEARQFSHLVYVRVQIVSLYHTECYVVRVTTTSIQTLLRVKECCLGGRCRQEEVLREDL
jgi:hypothetical protein